MTVVTSVRVTGGTYDLADIIDGGGRTLNAAQSPDVFHSSVAVEKSVNVTALVISPASNLPGGIDAEGTTPTTIKSSEVAHGIPDFAPRIPHNSRGNRKNDEADKKTTNHSSTSLR